ncbi:MAG TPA: acetolactate synthase small subunit [Acidimicrobiaceae bacterium]|nr:acetolactate synthase small subunit [Acidimicrobiaceae bacterium]
MHILAAVVENKFGVLARIAGLFSRRGFNIFSLAVAPTHDPEFSRVTIVVDLGDVAGGGVGATDTNVDQIAKQLDKLINVVQISELRPAESVERELLLARVSADDRVEVDKVLARWGGSVLDADDDEMIVSVDAHPSEIDRCEAELRKFGIGVLQRTGRIALRKLSQDEPPVAVVEQL